jgi:tRNA A37 methylthiotransferase MiaB
LPEKRKGEFLIGKSHHYKTVKLKSDKYLVGKTVKVKIIEAFPWGLKGKFIKKVKKMEH